MNCFIIISLLILHLLTHLTNSTSSSTFPGQCRFPAVINFGDSNSDTGGFSATFGPLGPPFGETFFEKPAGRFSDGRLIIDFIAEELGLPYISAYLDSLGANYSHGVNFATAVSTILTQNETLSNGGDSPFSLDIQLKQFLQFKYRSQQVSDKGGVFKDLMSKEGDFSQALYMLDIGQNDLTQGFFANKSIEEFVPDAINRFSTVVKSLYDNGARSIWIHNTGPLGCLPYVLARIRLRATDMDPIGCAIVLNRLAQHFNVMLYETVVKLRKELSLAAITYVDVYSAKYSLFINVNNYGFEQPLTACCGYGDGVYNYNPNVLCGATTTMANGVEVLLGKSCENPNKRIIWDGPHYTEAANKLIFKLISTGKFSDPPMSSLMTACQRL